MEGMHGKRGELTRMNAVCGNLLLCRPNNNANYRLQPLQAPKTLKTKQSFAIPSDCFTRTSLQVKLPQTFITELREKLRWNWTGSLFSGDCLSQYWKDLLQISGNQEGNLLSDWILDSFRRSRFMPGTINLVQNSN